MSLAFACTSHDGILVIAQRAVPAPIPCDDSSDCPTGKTCEDYDCNGVSNCAQPGQGGGSEDGFNCCLNGDASCRPDHFCSVDLETCLPWTVAPCDDREECGGQCMVNDVQGGCAVMSNGECACVPLA